jgi:hypothetical protein
MARRMVRSCRSRNTILQPHSFYGAPWLTGLMELHHVSGPTINQACATGVRSLDSAAGRCSMKTG